MTAGYSKELRPYGASSEEIFHCLRDIVDLFVSLSGYFVTKINARENTREQCVNVCYEMDTVMQCCPGRLCVKV